MVDIFKKPQTDIVLIFVTMSCDIIAQGFF